MDEAFEMSDEQALEALARIAEEHGDYDEAERLRG